MKIRYPWFIAVALCIVGLQGVFIVRAEDPPKSPAPRPAEAGTLIILDSAGKEQTVKSWEFTAGTRHLAWLAAAPSTPEKPLGKDPVKGGLPAVKVKVPAGPGALEFLHEMEIKFLPPVLTLVPFDRLRSLEYDNEKNTVTAHVMAGTKDNSDIITLTGSTKYRRLNKLTVEAEVDKGDAGIAAIKFQGGVPRGIRGIRFPAKKFAAASPAGRPALVITADGPRKTTHKVADLLALYQFADGSTKLLPSLMFKKTLKLDVAKIKTIVVEQSSDMEDSPWQVVQKDGEEATLTLLHSIPSDGKQGQLVGLVGRVPVGYKLFPVPTLAEVRFDSTDEEKKDDKKEAR